MTRKFIYTEMFRRSWKMMGLEDEHLIDLEYALLTNPHEGDVIEGTGGARKMRISLGGRGKRGGGRVIYLDVFEREHLYLIFAYPKNMQSDMTVEQRKIIKQIVDDIKRGGDFVSDVKLNSSLTMDEIEKNFRDMDFFSCIKDGLNEAKAYANGKPTTKIIAHDRKLPDVNVAKIRESLSITQKTFAAILGVSCRTVEAWESGRSNPTPTAKKLMFLIQEDHQLISKLHCGYD